MATLMTFMEDKNKKQFIRIVETSSHTEIKSIAVGSNTKHGLIHADGIFGRLRFSHDETKLLYVAEREYKPSNYFDAETDWDDQEKWSKGKVVSFSLKTASLQSILCCNL